MSAFTMTSSAWRRMLVVGFATVSLGAALPASAGPMPIGTAQGLQAQVVPAVAEGGFDGAQVVKVRGGRNAAAAAIVGGIAALGVGAAIASQNRSYGYGGGYYAQPQGYYAQPQGYYAAPQTYYYEEPVQAYEPAPVYVEPAPVYAPVYGYGYYPHHRHYRNGWRQMNNFRDRYR